MIVFTQLLIISGFIISFMANEGRYNTEANIKITGSFAQINSQKALIDSTNSPEAISRYNAVLRLIQMGDSASVPAVIEVYRNTESRNTFIDDSPGLEYWSLYAIGKLGGSRADNYLWKVADELLNPDIIFRPLMGDTLYRIKGLFEGLSIIEPEDSSSYYLNYYNDNMVIPDIRLMAYETYLWLYLKNHRFSTTTDKINYLLDELRQVPGSINYIKPGVPSSDFIKKNALKSVIIDLAVTNPKILTDYRNKLKADDSFAKEVEKIIQTTNSRIMIINNP